eukprot:c46541_g1_i1 orf=14-331(+)
MLTSHCTTQWIGGSNIFEAGSEAILRILQMDMFGNNISQATGVYSPDFKFEVGITRPRGDNRKVLDDFGISLKVDPTTSYQYAILMPKMVGTYMVNAGDKTTRIL